jgi:hypothetical protein
MHVVASFLEKMTSFLHILSLKDLSIYTLACMVQLKRKNDPKKPEEFFSNEYHDCSDKKKIQKALFMTLPLQTHQYGVFEKEETGRSKTLDPDLRMLVRKRLLRIGEEVLSFTDLNQKYEKKILICKTNPLRPPAKLLLMNKKTN